MKRQPKIQPLLRCPECGYEYRPVMHGWAFMTSSKTKCDGHPGPEDRKLEGFRHPFKVQHDE